MWVIVLFACLLSSLQYVVLEEIDPEDRTQHFSTTPRYDDDETDSVTIPEATCPPEKSLYNRKDIRTIINFLANHNLIYQSINESYFDDAIAVRRKHMDDLNSFLVWFQNRPEHLKHVLQDFSSLKIHIEQNVRKVADILGEYSQLEEKYEEQSQRTNKLSKDINRYKVICENNCPILSLMRMSYNVERDNYYCSTLEDLHRNIESKLSIFAQNLSSVMQEKLASDDHAYTQKIGELKKNLKDFALQEFGRTMYDILSLSDEYHHFIKNVLDSDVKSQVHNIKDISLLIDSELLELEHRAENYGDYCRTCNNAVPFRKNIKRSINNNMQVKSTNIVDQLLNIKYNEIITVVHFDYLAIFDDLNSVLNNIDPEDIYSTNLKPIQDELLEMLKNSRAELEALKSIVPQWSINSLSNLLSKSQQLLSNIRSKNAKLKPYAS